MSKKESPATSEEDKKKKQERVWADINEGLKFVCEGGKVECKASSVPEGDLFGTSTEVQLQDKPYITNKDNQGIVNIRFKDSATCGLYNNKKTCKEVIQSGLGEWKDYSDVHIDQYYALIASSTIQCNISTLKITHSGQIAVLSDADPFPNLRVELITPREDIRVCEAIEYEAIYKEFGERVEGKNIRWKVVIWSDDYIYKDGKKEFKSKTYNLEDVELEKQKLSSFEGKPLSEKKSEEGADQKVFKIKGDRICLNIPKEWGQKKVSFFAYLGDKTAWDRKKLYVKDHIVAAFFRIDPNTPKSTKPISNIKKTKGSNNMPFMPVHHHQGMYKVANQFYISGSTSVNHPSYAYIINDNGNSNYSHETTIQLTGGVLDKYRHAGGMQVAGGLMAIGIEQYNYSPLGFFGSAVHQRSILCFFEGGTELKELRVIKDSDYFDKLNGLKNEDLLCLSNDVNRSIDPENTDKSIDDYASAVGIIFCKKRLWLEDLETATITQDNVYYVISRGKTQGITLYEINEKKTSIKSITILAKGDWLGEFQNVNLHQDERGDIYMFGMGKSQMGGVDKCRIFELFIRGDNASIYATWINDSGEIEKDLCILPYVKERKNELTFTCSNDTSFHWASCIQMEDTELLSNSEKKNKDLKDQNITEGFRGIFTIYTINGKVEKKKIKLSDNKKDSYTDYQIQCNSFTEPDLEEDQQQ